MRTRWLVSAALMTTALAVQPYDEAKGQGVRTYLDASGTEQKPRSNAGVSIEHDRLRMRADVALQAKQITTSADALQPRRSGSTEVVPNLRSAFTVAKHLDIETRVNFAEWNARSDATFDTRVRYRKALDTFFDEIDGSFWLSPDGATKQSLRLGFNQTIGYAAAAVPLTIRGAATVETSRYTGVVAAGAGARRLGIEASLAGFMPSFVAAEHALRFRAEKTAGMRAGSSSTVTYDQSWAVSPMTKLGLNLQFLRQTYHPADDFAPTVDFRWNSRF